MATYGVGTYGVSTYGAASLSVDVGGAGVVGMLAGSFAMTDRVEERSTCRFAVYDAAGTWNPLRGEPVTITDRTVEPETVIFTGYVDTVSRHETRPMSGEWTFDVACVDNHYLADKRIVARSYIAETCGAIVEDIIDRYLADEGITEGTIEAGPTVVEAIFNYVYADEALDALAERAGFTWRIDVDKALHFHARATVPAPFDLTETVALRRGAGIEFGAGNPEYRNRQYIRGAKELTDEQVETRIGDGETRTFTMAYPLAQEPTITLNAGSQTVGIRGVDTGKNWYWSKGDAVISQDTGDTVLESSDTLEVTYVGEFDIVVLAENPTGITDRATIEDNGTGYVEAVADISASSRDAAFDVAAAKLDRYGSDGATLAFETTEAGLQAGQLIVVDIAGHPLDGESFLISSVATRDYGPRHLLRAVQAVQGPVLLSWTRLLANPSTAAIDLLNVGGGTVLILLVSTFETATWTETVGQTAHACPLPASNLYPDEELYPC